MAGTIVADTLQDGAGNSTAMDNAIYGSAKAWVQFGYISSAVTVRKSYNVSSVTRQSSGNYTIIFTNALTDANYAVAATFSSPSGTGTSTGAPQIFNNGSTVTAPTTTQFVCNMANYNATGNIDPAYASFIILD